MARGEILEYAMERKPEKKLSLREQIAAGKKKQRHERIMAHDAEQSKALLDHDPTEGMSTMEKLGAGFQSGLRNVGRGAGNMLGMISDEDVAEAKRLDQPLGDTGAGAVGQFAGEMGALAPLSAPAGAAGMLAKAATSAPKLARALKARQLGTGIGGAVKAGTEGAAASALLADPGQRAEAAGSGAMLGAGLNKTAGAIARKFGKGFDKSDAAKKFEDVVGKSIGRKTSLPVAQSAESGVVKFPHKSVLSMFPMARGGSQKMAGTAQDDWAEAVIRGGYSKKHADEIVSVFKETGSFTKAIEKGREVAGDSPYLRQARDVLEDMSIDMLEGDKITPALLDKMSKKFTKGKDRPFYELSSVGSGVLSDAIEESTVAGRRGYNKLADMAKVGGGVALAGPVGYMGMNMAARGAAGAPMQKFMMGNTGANRGIEKSMESLYADMLRNTLAGQDY